MGPSSLKRSGLDFEHRQNESDASVFIYGEVRLLQQLNIHEVLIILLLNSLNNKNIDGEK